MKLTHRCAALLASLFFTLAAPNAFGLDPRVIPLHVIALSDDDGDRGNLYTALQVASVVDDVNLLYAPALIQFTFDPNKDWEERWDTGLNSMQNSGADWWQAPNAVAARYPGKIVIFLRYGPGEDGAGNGFAYPPNTGQMIPPSVSLPTDNVDFVALLNQSGLNAGFVAHEIGHYLGLYHTQPSWGGGAEGIQNFLDADGKDGLDGDGLADTPPDGAPDHYMANSGAASACAGTGVYQADSDLDGTVQIEPDRQNIMGYFRCGSVHFSLQQVLTMHTALEHDFRRHLIEPVCFPDHHRLPLAKFQRCVDYWSHKGRWPVTVSAADLGRVTMTSSIQKGDPRWVRHLATSSSYQATAEAAYLDGFRPEQVQGVLIEGEPRWTAVWTPIASDFSSRHGATLSEFADSWAKMTDAGYQLVDFNLMDDWLQPASTTRRFNFTWEKQGSMDFIAHYDMSAADYQALFLNYDNAGYEVVRFSTYTTSLGKRYAALWHPQKKDYAHIPWQTAPQYQTNAEAYAASGFVIRQLHDYDGLISAIWIREPRKGGGPNDPPGGPNDPHRHPNEPRGSSEPKAGTEPATSSAGVKSGALIQQSFGDLARGGKSASQ